MTLFIPHFCYFYGANIMNQTYRIKITSALAYFDIFNYPLNINEISRFTPTMDDTQLRSELEFLIKEGIVFQHNEFYSLQDNSLLATKRLDGNILAEQYLNKATRNAALIAKFPFVKGVYISGSLSKGYMAPDGDVDYFIITSSERLWIARTLLILYKKIFLFNSRKYFCVNYFIDEENLEIEQQNIFTATELVTLLPMTNPKLYEKLLDSNTWLKSYYNNALCTNNSAKDIKRSLFQKIIEPLLNGKIGLGLDKWFMKITLKKWFNKFKTMSKEDFDIAMKSTRKVSKHHPSNFQKKVLKEYDNRVKLLNEKLYVKDTV